MYSEWHLAIAAIGAVVLALGLFSGLVRRWPVSEPMLAMVLGVALGPAGLDLLSPARWGNGQTSTAWIMTEAARLTLAIGLMGVALRLPRRYFREHAGAMAMLLGPVMVLMWLVSGALSAWLLGLGVWTALLLAACMTPTDPVLASAIVSGGFARDYLPARLRHVISAESGANDGLGLMFVMLPMLMLEATPGAALGDWLAHTLIWEVLFAVVVGWLIGVGAGYLLHWGERRESVSQTSLLSYTLALSLTVLGVCQLLGSDGILAVFVAGRGFVSVATQEERNEDERVQEAVNQFFILPVFVLLGMALPWGEWAALGWGGVALAGGVLLLRRLPTVWALRATISPLRYRRDAIFAGWFGPIGVAAMFYASDAAHEAGAPVIWHAASLVIFSSIIAHGVTAAPAIRWYARNSEA